MATIAEVALALPLRETYHYACPEGLEVGIGARVLVPVQRRMVTGFVLSLPEASEHELKPIESVLGKKNFGPELVPLFKWLAGYYCHPIGLTIKAALPPSL